MPKRDQGPSVTAARRAAQLYADAERARRFAETPRRSGLVGAIRAAAARLGRP